MKKQVNKPQFLIIAVLCNVAVLSLLLGISFLIIQVLLQGKIDKTLIPFFGLTFFLGSVFTTSLVYRFVMRRFLKTEHMDDIFKPLKKEPSKDKKG